MKWFAAALAVMCFTLVTARGALAQRKGPCAEDVAKFCKDVRGANIVKCLREHAKELSPGCKETLVEAKQKLQEVSEVCGDDLKKFCNDVKPGGPEELKCLKGHQQELSPDCKDLVRK
jgi:hypothetical protein